MTAKHPVSTARRRRQRGSAIVESSITFLAFIFLTLGLMDFSMTVYAYNFCTYAANDGARYASLHGFHSESPATAYEVQNFVRSQAVALINSRVIVESTWIPNNHPGSVVQVKVRYRVSPLVNLMIKNDMYLSSTSRMVIAH